MPVGDGMGAERWREQYPRWTQALQFYSVRMLHGYGSSFAELVPSASFDDFATELEEERNGRKAGRSCPP